MGSQRANSSRKALSDDQYLKIEEMRLMEFDIQMRLQNYIRESGHDVRYNTRALESAQGAFEVAFMFAAKGIANEGVGQRSND